MMRRWSSKCVPSSRNGSAPASVAGAICELTVSRRRCLLSAPPLSKRNDEPFESSPGCTSAATIETVHRSRAAWPLASVPRRLYSRSCASSPKDARADGATCSYGMRGHRVGAGAGELGGSPARCRDSGSTVLQWGVVLRLTESAVFLNLCLLAGPAEPRGGAGADGPGEEAARRSRGRSGARRPWGRLGGAVRGEAAP